jgi:hypothetical protein
MEKRSIDRERAVVADDQMAEIPQPGEGPLDDPTPFVAPKNAAILWWCPAAVQAQGRAISTMPRRRNLFRSASQSYPLSAITRSGFCRGRPARCRRPTRIDASVCSARRISDGDAE